MKPQSPAQGIMETYRDANSVSYRVDCACQHDDHSISAWIEVHPERNNQDVEITFYVNTFTPVFASKFARFRAALNILFRGESRQQHEIILNKQTAINFTETLTKSINTINRERKRV